MCAFCDGRGIRMIKICENETNSFAWDYLNAMEGRLGIVSKNDSNPIMEHLKKTCTNLNGIVVQLTTKKKNAEIEDYLSILDFEGVPTENPDSIFGTVRMNWVQNYLNLLAFIHKKERKSFIPSGSYRSHVEGPMMGYIRAVKDLEDSEDKNILLHHFEKLEQVKWFRSEEEGFVYEINGETEAELLESFYLGAWSLWTFVNTVEQSNPLNIMIELDGLLIDYPVLNEKRDFIAFGTTTISRLSFDYLVSVVIKSSSLFPLPESLMDHYLIESNDSPDFDWSATYPEVNSLGEDMVIWKHKDGYEIMKLVLANDVLI